METLDFIPKEKAKILIIGHDPRLRESSTIANYAFFANYYFKPIPREKSEQSKYELAKSCFEHILSLTSGKFKAETFYITNLCNVALPHAPKGKIVYIPEVQAKNGLDNIQQILNGNPSIEYIFPMSVQVNYWLQKLKFYNSLTNFVELTEPRIIGINNNPPYFEPKTDGTFKMICGKPYKCNNYPQITIPILHTKNFPLKDNFLKAYGCTYTRIVEYLKTAEIKTN